MEKILVKTNDKQSSKAIAISAASNDQSSKALILQTYCNSVLQQPKVDFSAVDDLATFQEQINTSLLRAQQHANNYLNSISPSIISSLASLENYFTLYSSVPVILPADSTVEQWVTTLQAMKIVCDANLRDSKEIVISLQNLSTDLAQDSSAFAEIVVNLNLIMKGDNGVLDSIADSLNSIDNQIAGTITAMVGEGLGIAGGVFTIVVGAVADFVTAGTNPELIIGGIVMVVAGLASEVGSSITLGGLYNQKASLLTEKSQLTAEVSLVSGISSAYNQISTQAASALESAKSMQNTWELTRTDLQDLSDDLQNGIINVDDIRTMFLNEANSDIANILTDIATIKAQMAGVNSTVLPKGDNISSYLATLNTVPLN